MDNKAYLKQLKAISLSLEEKQRIRTPQEITVQQRQIHTLTDSFGCKSNYAKEFASAFINFDLRNISQEGTFVFSPGLLVIPIVNLNSHNYPLNKITCILNGDVGYRPERKDLGNHLIAREQHVRLADRKEIEKFYEEIEEDPTSFIHLMSGTIPPEPEIKPILKVSKKSPTKKKISKKKKG